MPKLSSASNVGVGTISDFERGSRGSGKTSATSIEQIAKALEEAGIEFTEGEGVKLRCQEIRLYKGSDSCDQFFDEIMHDVKDKESDVFAFIKSHDILTRYSGEPRRTNLERLIQLRSMIGVKCIMSDIRSPSFVLPTFEIRTVAKHAVNATSFFVYGNKMAFILLEADFTIATYYMPTMAREHRIAFMAAWDNALHLQNPHPQRNERPYTELAASA